MKKVIGIVKIVKIGLTTVFRKASTTATNKAATKPSSFMPGNNFAVITTATAEINMFAKNFTLQKYLKKLKISPILGNCFEKI